MLGGRESHSARSWEDKYLLVLQGFEPLSAQPLANYYIDYVSFVQSGSLQAFLVVQVRSSSFCDTAQRHWVFGGRRFGPDIDFVFRGGEVKVSLEDWAKPRRRIRTRIRRRNWRHYVMIYMQRRLTAN
jgi:hypothetical protein